MKLQDLKPAHVLDIFIRRKWLILLSIVCCVGIAWGVCFILPKSYRSSTLILVENQRVPERYVSAAVGGTVSERLTMINQYVLSRTMLGEIIDEFKLLGNEKSDPVRKEEFLAAMKKNVKVETKGGGRVEAFSISFAHSEPTVAMEVTARLASKFVDENLKSREELVEGTTEFLNTELTRAKEALVLQEDAITHFKRKAMGELPGQMEANLQTLNRLEKELASLEITLQNRADRRLAIQRMLQGYETLGFSMAERQAEVLEAVGSTAPNAPSLSRGGAGKPLSGTGSNPLIVRLRELERTLSTLSAEYKATYPDIVKVKQEIAQVKAALAEKNVQSNGSEGREEIEVASVAGTTEKAKREKKPVPTVIDPYVFDLKKELNENEMGINALKEDQARHRVLVKEYQQRVERAPEREQELVVLQRDYENTKKNYESLLEKKLNARIAENLEKRQKGESFRILDLANLPTSPESPDVTRIMMLGLAMGCGLGFGSALALEQFMGVIRRPEDVESLLGLPVLASIPKFEYAYENLSAKQLSHIGTSADGSLSQDDGVRQGLEGGRKELADSGKAKLVASNKSSKYYDGRYGSSGGALSNQFGNKLNLVTKWRPKSIVSEQYRVAATRLVLLSGSQKGSVIVVTSSIPGEGKSSTAVNIAYVLAHDLGKPTILIDCDFKKPSIHTYTGVPSRPGLAELLYGDMPLDSCIHQADQSGLWVLPAGRRDHKLVDLAKIPDLKKMVMDLKGRFEYIVLDTPPILPLADINLLAVMADILLLVVRAEMTPQDVVEKAVKKLGIQGRSGIILNGCHKSRIRSKYVRDYYHVTPGAYLG